MYFLHNCIVNAYIALQHNRKQYCATQTHSIPSPYNTIVYQKWNIVPHHTKCSGRKHYNTRTFKPFQTKLFNAIPYHTAVPHTFPHLKERRTLWGIKKGGPDFSWGRKQIEGTKPTTDQKQFFVNKINCSGFSYPTTRVSVLFQSFKKDCSNCEYFLKQ